MAGALGPPGIVGWAALMAGVRPAVIVHASQTWAVSAARGDFDYLDGLAQVTAATGQRVYLLRAESLAARALLRRRRNRVHLLLGAPPHRGPWDFHIAPAHMPGFWVMDPEGTGARASIAQMHFDPSGINDAAAGAFADLVRKRMQPAAMSPLPPCAAVVFLQDIDDFRRPLHHIDTVTMLKTVARALAPAPVFVRLHPRQRAARAAQVRALMAEEPNLTITDAPVADLIAAAGVVVTQNSATGFQALASYRPVITCAQCDYHAATFVAHDPQELSEGVTGAAARALAGFPYDRYLWWYLNQQCLAPEAPDFAARLTAKLAGRDSGA
jgi:hypothetical protein